MLDEPTNDLDAETLEMLEERLIGYQGTMLVVSHDREFLNNVVTSCIVFEPDGVREYVGGYDDWLRQSVSKTTAAGSEYKSKNSGPMTAGQMFEAGKAAPSKAKLSFKETQELNNLPKLIEKIETAIAAKHELMADPDFYKKPKNELVREQSLLTDLETQLAEAFERWGELESRK